MFLKKVYRYNKPLGIGMLFFVLVQLFCFYKGGMVFSPWYNYGMFSERISIDSVYQVNTVGDLKGSSYSPQRWDKIHYTLQQYQMLSKNDSMYEKEIKRISPKLHLPIPAKSKFISNISDAGFKEWYSSYLKKMLSAGKIYLPLTSPLYKWNGEKLVVAETNPVK